MRRISNLDSDTVYYQRVNDVYAFVLAGGKSTRMGQDKAFLRLGGETLLERAQKLAKSVTENVRIVGDPAKFSVYGVVVPDMYPDRGPLGGIHAALVQTRTEFNLIMAVDTPFIEARFLDFIVSQARGGGAVVTVPRTGGYLHPLCGIYRREFAAVSEKALIREQNKIDRLFAGVQTRVIEEEEMAGMGFGAEMLRNVNTPDDWTDVQAWFKQYEKTDELYSKNERTQ
ncbi:MAG TPA: molybdenum cofactor guanylyltransferase [Terriglobales bacterium]|nr:molybdenum cofactor guanylyltransferase [Terriglobales bacterium]